MALLSEDPVDDGVDRPATEEGLKVQKAQFRGAAAALAESTRSGEDIALDKEAAYAVLGKAQGILDALTDHASKVLGLQQMSPPSPDMASEMYNKVATKGESASFFDEVTYVSSRAFDAGAEEINAQVKYLTDFIAALSRALGITVANDADLATTAQEAGTPKSDTGSIF